ncbi:MAG TPA: NADH-quinone oxidoreductase subunit J [Phycisphaerae bacterium]|nr:NADH-quinone oxidoreductase subunit J [Phycisphaerae bacterium]
MLAGVLLITLLTLGGVGLYLAMPGGRLNIGRAALVVLAGAAAALVAFLLPNLSAGADGGWFIALALIGLWGAIRVVTHRKPVYSALYFILVVIAVTGMLVLMQAEFLAAAVVIIYAGAILVTYVFVIMLAQQEGGPARYDRQAREPFVGVLTGFILLAIIAARVFTAGFGEASLPPVDETTAGSVQNVGTHLLTQFVVGLELAGVLLLAAMVGAIAIARRRHTGMVPMPPTAEPGEVD